MLSKLTTLYPGKNFFIFDSKDNISVDYRNLQFIRCFRYVKHIVKNLFDCSFNVNNLLLAKEQYEMDKASTWCVIAFIHTKHSYCGIQQNCYKRNDVTDYGWNKNFPIPDAHHLEITRKKFDVYCAWEEKQALNVLCEFSR